MHKMQQIARKILLWRQPVHQGERTNRSTNISQVRKTQINQYTLGTLMKTCVAGKIMPLISFMQKSMNIKNFIRTQIFRSRKHEASQKHVLSHTTTNKS